MVSKPPADPEHHAGWFKAQCHKLLRHKSDKFVANALPGSVVGMHNACRSLPPAVDIDRAGELAEEVLQEQRDYRGLNHE